MSQQLAALEREAGVRLLERRGRRLALTPAGELLVTHAEVILGDLAAAEADLAALRGGPAGAVRVAAFPSAARTLLPYVWRRAGPALRMVEQEPEVSVEALRRGEVDVAVAHAYTLLPRVVPDTLRRYPLLGDAVLLALPVPVADRHGLAEGAPARLDGFAAEPWLVPNTGVSCYEMIQRACGAAGFVPTVVAQATDFSVLAALVAAGAGVALVPRMALPADTRGLSLHPLARPVTREVFALTPAGATRHPDIRRTVDLLVTAAAGYCGGVDGAGPGSDVSGPGNAEEPRG